MKKQKVVGKNKNNKELYIDNITDTLKGILQHINSENTLIELKEYIEKSIVKENLICEKNDVSGMLEKIAARIALVKTRLNNDTHR